ncbi:hypothetical protein [Streptomyces sindenensis]|uniref:Uncharacterized protein n=1 Tax=Streptomyces sindenensis TaxID=67363 RepID=A0ABW6EQP1_9ACTN
MAGDDGGYLIDSGRLPDVGRALLRHRALVHRLGQTGDALIADAHQVMLWWWVNGQVGAKVWREREDALGQSRHRRRAAPVAVYPEAVTLAEIMWAWEKQRDKRLSPDAWIAEAARAITPTGVISRRERAPLDYWLEQHRTAPATRPRGRTTEERRWNRLPELHHRPPQQHGPLRAPSCLMWVYGLPLTETSAVCPECNGRAPSCRWVPYPECTGLPDKRTR